MAVIKCPDCGKDISEKTKKCIHCGCPIKKEKSSSNRVFKIVLISIIISVIVFLIIILNERRNNNKKFELQLYEDNLTEITYNILNSSADSEKCGNLINNVWYNSIWEKDDEETNKYTKKDGVFNDDFNDSLSALFIDEEFSELVDEIKNDQKEIGQKLKEMKEYPEEFEEEYQDLKEFYNNYIDLSNLCINPSGSYNSYTSRFHDADDKVSNSYTKMKSHLDD